MFKKILASVLALFAAAAFAAVDVNKATQAELEAVKGIGPAISGKILDERKKAPFKDWGDMVERVKGVGEGNAAKFSAEGLTVNGTAFSGAPAKPAAPAKADKPAAKPADVKPATAAAPAAPVAPAATPAPAAKATAAAPAATAVKADAKPADAKPMAADDKKAAAAKAKEDKKAAAAKAKEDKKAAAAKEKEDKKAAKAAAGKASAPADAKK